MPRFRDLLLAATAAGLAACASPPRQPAIQAPADPPVPEANNGIYRGTSTRFQSDARSCPRPGLVTLYVQNREFDYRWDRKTYVSSAISPDGRITGQAEGITLAGRQHGKKLEGDVTNGICGLHFTVQKQEF